MQLFDTKVIAIEQLTPHIVELGVDLINPPAVAFQAGQFMEFKIGHSSHQDRAYSIISLPKQQNSELKFCVKLINDGVGSTFVSNLKPGDHIQMEGPFGIFTVKDFEHDAFFVATGVGVAPFLSMIPDMLARGFRRSITLLFGVREGTDSIYKEYFDALAHRYKNFNYLITLTRPGADWTGLTGRVTSFIEREYPRLPQCRYYICGGLEMVQDTRALLLKLGQMHAEIAVEVFS